MSACERAAAEWGEGFSWDATADALWSSRSGERSPEPLVDRTRRSSPDGAERRAALTAPRGRRAAHAARATTLRRSAVARLGRAAPSGRSRLRAPVARRGDRGADVVPRRRGPRQPATSAPPVAPGIDYRAHWNGFDSGAGAPSYQIVSLPYFEGLRLFSWLGLGEVAFQRLWLTVLLAGDRGERRLPGSRPRALAARRCRSGLRAAVQRLPPDAGVRPCAAGGDDRGRRAGWPGDPRRSARAGRGRSSSAWRRCPAGFVALNPPHLALVLAWIVVCVAARVGCPRPRGLRARGRFLLAGVPLALLFNLWWIVPAALTHSRAGLHRPVRGRRASTNGPGRTRGNVLNVVTFTSNWAWSYPEYFPFSARLERPPFTAPVRACARGGGSASRWRSAGGAGGADPRGGRRPGDLGHEGPPRPARRDEPMDLRPHAGVLAPARPGEGRARAGARVRAAHALGISRSPSARVGRDGRRGARGRGRSGLRASLLTGAVVPTERPLLPSAHVRVPPGGKATADLETRPANGQGRRPAPARLLPDADDVGLLRRIVPAPTHRPPGDRAATGAYYRDPRSTPWSGVYKRRSCAVGRCRALCCRRWAPGTSSSARPRHRIPRPFAGLTGPAGETARRRDRDSGTCDGFGRPTSTRRRASDARGVSGGAGDRG